MAEGRLRRLLRLAMLKIARASGGSPEAPAAADPNAHRDRVDAVMRSFEERRGTWLDQARAVARVLAEDRGTVTIDDVRKVCPPPDDVDPRVMGAVLRAPDFIRIGFKSSDRPESTGRGIGIFRYAGGHNVGS